MRRHDTSSPILSIFHRRCTRLLIIPAILCSLSACSRDDTPTESTPVADLPAGPLADPLGRSPSFVGEASSTDATIGTPAPGGGTLLVSEGVAMTVPEGWVQETPESTMRAAQFRLPPADGAAPGEMAVFRIRGGGVEDNFTRWIGQFSSMPGEPQRGRRTAGNLAIDWIKLRGTLTVAPMAGGTGEAQPDSVFYGIIIMGAPVPMQIRISGPAATLDRHAQAITDFINSIEPSN
ncbi:MAG: hypothetical protein EA380_06575 [Phycisphaeraceae bacterium]|nr:MAG: hypothetical protein EA380_06575 [Phycisphaeraceae bacterium]